MKNHATIFGVKNAPSALIVDDDQQVCGLVAEILRTDGWDVSETYNHADCLTLLPQNEWDLIICDVMLGADDGYSILREFRAEGYPGRFVMMTGQGSAAGALDATAIGAYDYIVKPFKVDEIRGLAASVREHIKSNSRSKEQSSDLDQLGYVSDIPLIGKSRQFVECLKMVGRVAATELPILITGESGTGKEVVARAIHQRSRRKNNPFVAVNCGAIPVELIESELFGHVKGSFTGADRERVGLWEEADTGSIFLDEITETNQLFQVKLLRALQEGEIRRVGSNRSQKLDVRVIAATNRSIESEVDNGHFRQDLMFTLNAVTIELPPLRGRREDIALLANHFLKSAAIGASGLREWTPKSIQLLERYDWPGNVRELENAVLHAVSLSDNLIHPEHLPLRIREFEKVSFEGGAADHTAGHRGDWMTLDEMETEYVRRVLRSTDNNKQAASRILNIDRKTLSRIADRKTGDMKKP